MWNRVFVGLLATALALASIQTVARADAFERITKEKLEAVHQAVLKLKSERRESPRSGPLKEFRANLHMHSAFSHDSRGKVDEIVAAAKAVGTQVLMFSEHPAKHYDFFKDGHQGIRDGVLLIPGAETKGMLVHPRQSVNDFESKTPQELSDIVRGHGGLTFLSHLEERMDWEIRGLTGVEIYNTHADFKDEKRLAKSLRNPLWLFQASELIRKYPQESYSALLDYPADYLRRWDQLCEQTPHTGVSANDAHQNVGLVARLAEGNKARIEDALGEKWLELDASVLTTLKPTLKTAKVGDVLFQLQLDPYEYSLRHVGTHLLMPELTREAVWQSLQQGRAFVAFDWIADASGFDFAAESAGKRHEMGSHARFANDLRLVGRAPLSAHWKLIRNGKPISESVGATFEARPTEPGNYRVELWLKVAGESRVWILSNPIYITKVEIG